jgi:hypothetical protein
MDTVLPKEVEIPMSEVLTIEQLLRQNGLKHVTVIYSKTTAILEFTDAQEYLIFVLRGIREKAKNESGVYLAQPDFDFMIRLEKKLRTYSTCDEYIIRRNLKRK